MLKKHNYRCICNVGNMSTIETEMMKNALIKFLESFLYKDFEKIKIHPMEDRSFYYEFNIDFSNSSELKVKRFSNSLIQFCLFWQISIHEFYID
ncbi:hypothetical protein [Cellulophaga baltica]|jgi:hypothetical protein|uniref:hypothetical protein n=1 Tax=Cellulophaga baltica TaxID=76594 RepID=UPI000409EF80|nr:hypothetical protein [Cellulophaga baltica]